jgi:hypothetical protein
MAALSTIHGVTGRILVSSIYPLDIYGSLSTYHGIMEEKIQVKPEVDPGLTHVLILNFHFL